MKARLGVAFLFLVAILQQVQCGDCASDKQRKSGQKKMKNKNNYRALLRTLTLDGLPDNKGSGNDKSVGNTLMRDLFSNYNNNIRPVAKPRDTLQVMFGVSVIEVLDLNEDNGHARINTWVRMSWKDQNLQWNPTDYDGLDELHLPANVIWLPDIMLFNNAESENPINADVNVLVKSDGSVTWVAPATYHVTCRHEFRGNSWACPLRFASWTYNGNQLDIQPLEGVTDLDTSEFLRSDYFSLLEHKGRRDERTFGDDNTPYPSMTYYLKLRNKIGPSLLGK